MTGKTSFPFMVFGESLPEAKRLHDPNTPAEEKEQIRREINDAIDVVGSVTKRNTQRGRHVSNHARRDKILSELRCDTHGKPLRGEPKRLARAYNISVRTVEKWIEQVSQTPATGTEVVRKDWRTVYYGKMLSHQNSVAGRQRKKRQS